MDKILERTHQEQNTIIYGRVFASDVYPCFAVLNRGRQSQMILGPNRFYYDVNNGADFRVHVPTQMNHPFFNDQDPTTLEVYSTTVGNMKIKNATKLLSDNMGVNLNVDGNWDPATLES